ncbi:MAG: hypoxanthine phosphoribosyltransferase [Desulfatiglans sp.]|jgi:hypoxanthine phosphoribosyltransferase|nr:hypoxanthine phosphoribosyltransferase [Desulfatiglans sp.]
MNILNYPHEIILSSEQIKERVSELGQEITRDYIGHDLLAICVLKGSILFFADLIRAIDLPLTTDFILVSSYNGNKESSGKAEIRHDITMPVKDRDILIVEDIIDTGISVDRIVEHLKEKGPNSIKICVLLDKKGARSPSCNIRCDYSGFDVPEKFLIGYGLDYNEKYRNLPFIAAMD